MKQIKPKFKAWWRLYSGGCHITNFFPSHLGIPTAEEVEKELIKYFKVKGGSPWFGELRPYRQDRDQWEVHLPGRYSKIGMVAILRKSE